MKVISYYLVGGGWWVASSKNQDIPMLHLELVKNKKRGVLLICPEMQRAKIFFTFVQPPSSFSHITLS